MGCYTWGQLRLQLQQSAPGVSLDLLDEWLNTRYANILDRMRWDALEETAYIETVAAYWSQADTVNVTQGATTVTGTGTAWTSALNGQRFQAEGDGPNYAFTVVNPTTATLDRPYESSSETGAGYKLFTNIYPLPSNCKTVLSVESADDGFRLTDMTELEMGDSVGFRDELGDPSVYSVDYNQGNGQPFLELFPIPMWQKGYPVRYLVVTPGFNGVNTADAPLAFVSDGALLAGCRASIATHLERYKQATVYEAQFEREVAVMIKAEMLRRKKTALKPARWMSRHRIVRLLRNTFPRIPN